jgi:hypothetical protein
LIKIDFALEETKMSSMLSIARTTGRAPKAKAILLALLAQVLTNDLAAQGLPTRTASHIPVALWFIGTGVLGVVMVYGILHNRKRTRAERQITEQGTKNVYAAEDRSERAEQ